MPDIKIDLEEYVDRKVRVHTVSDAIEGKVEAANNEKNILLVKVKGKSSAVLVLGFEIERIEIITSSDDDITQSVLKPVKLNNVRRHLVSAHGWKLTDVNKITDDEAFLEHSGLHESPEAADLGHRHEDKGSKLWGN